MSALPAPQRRTGGPDPGPDPPPGAAPLRPPPANERRALRRRPRPSQPHRIQTAERDGARAGGRARGGLRGGGANGNIRAPSDAPPPSLPPPNPTAAGAAPASRLPPFSPPLTPHPAGKRPQRERGFAGAGARPGAAPSPHDNSGVLSAGGAATPSLLSSPLLSRHRGGSLEAIPPSPLSPAALSLRRRDARGSRGQKEPPRISAVHCGCGAAPAPPVALSVPSQPPIRSPALRHRDPRRDSRPHPGSFSSDPFTTAQGRRRPPLPSSAAEPGAAHPPARSAAPVPLRSRPPRRAQKRQTKARDPPRPAPIGRAERHVPAGGEGEAGGSAPPPPPPVACREP